MQGPLFKGPWIINLRINWKDHRNYRDDLTVFSKQRTSHIIHLKQVFKRCRKYGISLNPTKSALGIEEGKNLGHFISKYGVKVYLEGIEAIKNIPLPKNVKSLQSFNDHINFIRIFIPNLLELMKLTHNLLNKYDKFEWNDER